MDEPIYGTPGIADVYCRFIFWIINFPGDHGRQRMVETGFATFKRNIYICRRAIFLNLKTPNF